MPLVLLLAAFTVLTHVAARTDVSGAEARLLWIVRDPEKVEPAAPGDTLRLFGRNFRAMTGRAEPSEWPLAVPLDLWTVLAGGSILAARLPAVLLAMLAAALLMRLTRRASPRAQVIVGASALSAALILYGLMPMRLASAVEGYVAARAPDEPVVTLFHDDSPLGYYQAQADLRRGIGVDLGWRAFSAAEIARVVGNLGGAPVWLLMDVDVEMPYDEINAALLDSGRVLTSCRGLFTHIAVLRYKFSSFTPTVACGP